MTQRKVAVGVVIRDVLRDWEPLLQPNAPRLVIDGSGDSSAYHEQEVLAYLTRD